MSASKTCPICDSTGLYAKRDLFSPEIIVHELCPYGCQTLPPDYSETYCFSLQMSWPAWMEGLSESQVEPREPRGGRGDDDGVNSQT